VDDNHDECEQTSDQGDQNLDSTCCEHTQSKVSGHGDRVKLFTRDLGCGTAMQCHASKSKQISSV
jgi:hypothetical protein